MGVRRVVITGMGWVTPMGSGLEPVWASLLRGECAIGPVTRFDASTFATDFAAEVKNFALADYLAAPERHAHAGLNSQFALAAASLAWKKAGLDRWRGFDGRRMGMYLGAGEGPMDFENFAFANIAGWDAEKRAVNDAAWEAAAMARLKARTEVEQEPNIVLSHLAQEFGCRGPAFNCMTACAASTQAIGEAFEIIR